MTPSLLDTPAPRRRSRWPAWFSVVFTTATHVAAGLAVANLVVEPEIIQRAVALVDLIDIEAPPEPSTPEPELVHEPAVIAPTPKPLEPQRAAPEPAPAPPPAAPAAPVLARDDVVDLSNIVLGSGAKFEGGATASSGTSARAVHAIGARGAGDSVTTGAAAGARAPSVNRTRAPRLAGGASWSCPFPPEADVAGVNEAAVTLRVSVGMTGRVNAVQVTSEPGYGFGRAAKRCAMSKRWAPGLDASGRVTDATAVVNVRFVR